MNIKELRKNFITDKKNHWIFNNHRYIHIDAGPLGKSSKIYDGFNVENAAQMQLDAGAQAVIYFAKCLNGYSYYPTKIGMTHPGLKIDFVGEFTKELKKRGIKCIAYFYPSRERKHQMGHLEWTVKIPEWTEADSNKSLEIRIIQR